MTDIHKQYTMEDVESLQSHFKQQKIELLDECHDCLTDAINILEDGPIDENLVMIHFDIKAAIESIEKYTKGLLK